MTEHARFRAAAEDRLDRLVSEALPGVSRTRAQKLIDEGAVRVALTGGDGAAAEPAFEVATRSSQVVPEHALVEVALETPSGAPARPADADALEVPLTILYEDEQTLVIDKAPGIVVHPAPGVEGVTLVDVVRARYPEVREIDDSQRPGVVHRLDRDTSGVMVVAKSSEAQHMLKEQWREREPSKVYLALAEGAVDPPAGIIEAPLGPDPTHPGRRAVVEVGQSARSQYRVLEQYGAEAALLEVRIFTGRTHQIRVHLEAIGHPVVADTLYGRASELIPRQALHAWRLAFTLASTGERREFEAPLPADLEAALAVLRARYEVAPALPASSANTARARRAPRPSNQQRSRGNSNRTRAGSSR